MDAQERLHFGFLGEPFLFANLRIDSFGSFIAAASFIAATCFLERRAAFRSNVTYQCCLLLRLFQHFDSGYITSLEPSTRLPGDTVACINMENHVVLASDVPEDVRVYWQSHPHLILIMTLRLYMLAAMSLNLWILIVIVRQQVPYYDPS